MIAPIKAYFAHLVPNQIVVCVHQSVHVAVQTLQTVNSFNVELDLHEVLRIGANHKVDIVPVGQEQLLYHVYYVPESAPADCRNGLRGSCRAKITKQQLCFFYPPGLHSLVLRDLVRIARGEKQVGGNLTPSQKWIFILEIALDFGRIERHIVYLFYPILVDPPQSRIVFSLVTILVSLPGKRLEVPSIRLQQLIVNPCILRLHRRKQVCVLDLFFDSLTHAKWLQLVWKCPQRLVIASPESIYYGIALFVGVLIQH